jgi:hypothetical protein
VIEFGIKLGKAEAQKQSAHEAAGQTRVLGQQFVELKKVEFENGQRLEVVASRHLAAIGSLDDDAVKASMATTVLFPDRVKVAKRGH